MKSVSVNYLTNLYFLYGKSETLAGELLGATSRLVYRYFNDGDMLDIGYGRETCNPAGRFLRKYGNKTIAHIIQKLWTAIYEGHYEAYLN